MEKDTSATELDDHKCEGLDTPTKKEIESPRPQRIIELTIVDRMGMADK